MTMSQSSPLGTFSNASGHQATTGTSMQLPPNSQDINVQSTSASIHSAHQRIMNPTSMKPVTGVAVSRPVATTAIHSCPVAQSEGGAVSTTINVVRPMTPQEISLSFPTSLTLGPREQGMIQDMTELIASLKIPLTSDQITEISKMTTLRIEGLLGAHSNVFHADVYATQLTLLQFLSTKLTEFGFSDLTTTLKDHVCRVFAFTKEVAAEIATSENELPSSVKLMTPRDRVDVFGSRLDAYCLADLLREAAVLYTAEYACEFLRGASVDNNMMLFIGCIQRTLERMAFNPEVDKPALINFVYNRPALQAMSVSSIHSSGSIHSASSARLRRGVSPPSPFSARSSYTGSPLAVVSTRSPVHVANSPQVMDSRSPTLQAVVYVPEGTSGAAYSSAHVKTYSTLASEQAFPTSVTVRMRSSGAASPKQTTMIGMATEMLGSRPSSTLSQTVESTHADPVQTTVVSESRMSSAVSQTIKTSVESTAPAGVVVETHPSRMLTPIISTDHGEAHGASTTVVSESSHMERVGTHQEEVSTIHHEQSSTQHEEHMVSHQEHTETIHEEVSSLKETHHTEVTRALDVTAVVSGAVSTEEHVILPRSVSRSSTSSSVRATENLGRRVEALRSLTVYANHDVARTTSVAALDSSLRHSMTAMIETLNEVVREVDLLREHTNQRLETVTHSFGEFAQEMYQKTSSSSTRTRLRELSAALDTRTLALENDIRSLEALVGSQSTTMNELSMNVVELNQMRSVHGSLVAKVEDLTHALAGVQRSLGELDVGAHVETAIRGVYDHVESRVVQERTELRAEISESRTVSTRVHEEQFTTLRSQVEEIKHLLEGYKFKEWLEEAESVRRDMTLMRSEMEHFKTDASRSHVDITHLESRLKHLETTPAHGAGLSDVLSRLAGLETSLNVVQGPVAVLTREVDHLKQSSGVVHQVVPSEHVSALEARVRALEDRIRREIETSHAQLQMLEARLSSSATQVQNMKAMEEAYRRMLHESREVSDRLRVLEMREGGAATTSSSMLMTQDKIVINSNSPTNIYLNAEHADITPAHKETFTQGSRFGAPLVPRAALVDVTPQRRPGSESSKHKKASHKQSPPLSGVTTTQYVFRGDSPQNVTRSTIISSGSPTHLGLEQSGGTQYVMASSPLRISTGPSPTHTIPVTTTVTVMPQTTTTSILPSETVTLQNTPTMQAVYTRGAETGTYSVERSQVTTVAEHSAITSGIEGSPLARLSKEKETEQAMLKRLEAHYKAI